MYKDILVCIDLNDPGRSEQTLKTAVGFCQPDLTMLHVITVVPDLALGYVGHLLPEDFEDKALTSAREQLHAFTGRIVPSEQPVQHVVSHGVVYREIIDYAEKLAADLIVIGSHGAEHAHQELGPNVARVVRNAKATVLVVR